MFPRIEFGPPPSCRPPVSSPTDTVATQSSAAPLRRKLVWISILYFASGFPYGVFAELLPTYFRTRGVSLVDIGIVSALGFAWTLKFLWAPLVDRVGTRKGWIMASQVAIAVVLFLLAPMDASDVTTRLWLILGALAVLSATQDIAIDAYGIELLDTREYGAANGVRVTAYRVALIAAGGAFVALAGRIGWTAVLFGAAIVMIALALITLVIPSPKVEREAAESAAGELRLAVWNPLRSLLSRPGMAGVLLFVLIFKLGDVALTPMIRPFWVDSGYSPEQIGLVIGTVGMLATVAGALVGGGFTTRWGTFTALWMLGLTQALSNLGYWLAAARGAPMALMYSAAIVEQFTNGLGTAAFLAFLMSLCEKRYAATQYAVLSAVFVLGRTLASYMSGYGAQNFGYESYFLLTFAIAFPAFALLPFVRRALDASPAGA